MKRESVVGPDKYEGKTPVPTVTKPPTPEQKGLISRLDKRLRDSGLQGLDLDNVAGLSLIDSLSTSQLATLAAMLKKRNYTVKASGQYIKNLFATESELVTIAASAGNDFNKLLSILASDLLPGIGKEAAGTAPNLPSRQIYKYRDEDIDSIINDTYEAALMRKPSPEELEKQRNIARKKLEMGTLSTTKQVKNPKTGKLENVIVQTPGSSTEEVKTDIQTQLEKMNPDEIDRKKRIDFSSWLTQNAAGA